MKDFEKLIWRDALTFVDFFATWCAPCRMIHPTIDKFQERMKGRVDVYKIDIDSPDMQQVVEQYHIMSVPTFVIFRRGKILWRESGRIDYAKLVAVLEQVEKRELVE